MPLGLQDIDLGTTPGDETGTPGRTCFDRINQNNTAIESAVNILNGQFWTLDNTARSLALGERVQSDTHAGITHTLPSVFVYNAGNLNDIWIVNHDSAESITVAVASGDQLYRQGTGLGVDATISIAPGQLAIFSIRSDSATWNVIVMADEQTITGGSGDLLADGTIPMTAAWSMGGFGISNVGSIACKDLTTDGPEIRTPDFIVAYAGGGQANGTAITAGYTRAITVATSGDSAKLPVTVAGRKCTIVNGGANPMDVFPNTSATIKPYAANAAVSIPPYGSLVFYALNSLTWVTTNGAQLGIAQEYTKQQNFNATTLTDGANVSWDLDDNQACSVTLAGNRTLDNPTNMVDGATYILTVKQDATGSRTLAYGANYKWEGGTAPTLTTAANAVDILTFVSDGTSMFGVIAQDFS